MTHLHWLDADEVSAALHVHIPSAIFGPTVVVLVGLAMGLVVTLLAG